MRVSSDPIRRLTGHTRVYWAQRIQSLIQRGGKEQPMVWIKGRKGTRHRHSTGDPLWWFVRLTNEVSIAIDATLKRKRRDGNMVLASVVGLILLFWFFRVARAKAFDRHRPIVDRKQSLRAWQRWAGAMLAAITDESMDPQLFTQQWENPYLPGATDGVFR